MLKSRTVAEVDGWDYRDPEAIHDYDALARTVCGVIVKTSQGRTWVADYAPRAVRDAAAAGLIVGALHYADPVANEAMDEASLFLGNLPPAPFGLGCWLEIGVHPHLDTYLLAGWITEWASVIATSGLDTWVVCSPDTAVQISPWPEGVRWVATGRPGQDVIGPVPAATVLPTDARLQGDLVGYVLADVRSLNPPGQAVAHDAPGPKGEPGDDDEDANEITPMTVPGVPAPVVPEPVEPDPPPEVTGESSGVDSPELETITAE